MEQPSRRKVLGVLAGGVLAAALGKRAEAADEVVGFLFDGKNVDQMILEKLRADLEAEGGSPGVTFQNGKIIITLPRNPRFPEEVDLVYTFDLAEAQRIEYGHVLPAMSVDIPVITIFKKNGSVYHWKAHKMRNGSWRPHIFTDN